MGTLPAYVREFSRCASIRGRRRQGRLCRILAQNRHRVTSSQRSIFRLREFLIKYTGAERQETLPAGAACSFYWRVVRRREPSWQISDLADRGPMPPFQERQQFG